MKKRTLLSSIILLIVLKFGHAQEVNGIRFDTISTWNEIKGKALRENKYIFIDCYATWCGPCKAMDKDVYPSKHLGQFFNDKFISIRLQMDKTPIDNEYVKSWYKVAENFQNDYSLPGYPSLLFFSPEGKLVHKGFGFQGEISLIKLAKDATDSSKQYYALTQKYKSGKMIDPEEIRSYIIIAKDNGDKKQSDEIAKKFKKNYLDKLPINELYNIDNINFICNYVGLINSHDNFFKLFYKYPQKCDSLKPGGYSRMIVKSVIEREEINSKIYNGGNPVKIKPDWEKIKFNILKRYGKEYSDALVVPAMKKFALRTKDWKQFGKLQDSEISMTPIVPGNDYTNYSWSLNMAAWTTYLQCNDSSVLIKALSWSDLSISLVSSLTPNPSEQYYDTKARLLYKLGRIPEALENEQKAIDVGIQMARISGGDKGMYYDNYTMVLNRMKKGEPISDLN